MITRNEFYIALSLALAAATAPADNEAPISDNGKEGVQDVICFDFWPGNSLRIVGTNGRRMAVTYLKVAGLPSRGKFLVPVDKAAEALLMFAPDLNDSIAEAQGLIPRKVSMAFFGDTQMILSGNDDAMMVDATTTLYPEYHLMLEGESLPSKGAIYDLHTLLWVLNQAALVTHPTGPAAIAAHIRSYGPTTIRPKLRRDFKSIYDVMLAIRPFSLVN